MMAFERNLVKIRGFECLRCLSTSFTEQRALQNPLRKGKAGTKSAIIDIWGSFPGQLKALD